MNLNVEELTKLSSLQEVTRVFKDLSNPFLDSLSIPPVQTRRRKVREFLSKGAPQLPISSSSSTIISTPSSTRHACQGLDQRFQITERLLSLSALSDTNSLLYPEQQTSNSTTIQQQQLPSLPTKQKHKHSKKQKHQEEELNDSEGDEMIDVAKEQYESLCRIPTEISRLPVLNEFWYRQILRERRRNHLNSENIARTNQIKYMRSFNITFPSLPLQQQPQPQPQQLEENDERQQYFMIDNNSFDENFPISTSSDLMLQNPTFSYDQPQPPQQIQIQQLQNSQQQQQQQQLQFDEGFNEESVSFGRILEHCSKQIRNSIASSENIIMEPPEILTVPPNPYEFHLQGAKWLLSMYFKQQQQQQQQQGNGCMLADSIGLGQKLQIGVLLRQLAIDKNIWGPHLIVTKKDSLSDWKHSIELIAPEIKVLPYWGTLRQRNVSRKLWSIGIKSTKESNFHVIVGSIEAVLEDERFFRDFLPLNVLIVDGISHLCSPRWTPTLTLPSCSMRILMSSDLHFGGSISSALSVLQFLIPDAFIGKDPFQTSFGREAEIKNIVLTNDEKRAMNSTLQPLTLRRQREDILSQLPTIKEVFVSCSQTERQAAEINQILTSWNQNRGKQQQQQQQMAEENVLGKIHSVLSSKQTKEKSYFNDLHLYFPIRLPQSHQNNKRSAHYGTLLISEPESLVTFQLPKFLFRHLPSYLPSSYQCSSIHEQLLQWLFNIFTNNAVCDSLRPLEEENSNLPASNAFSFSRFCNLSPSEVVFAFHSDLFYLIESEFSETLSKHSQKHDYDANCSVCKRSMLLLNLEKRISKLQLLDQIALENFISGEYSPIFKLSSCHKVICLTPQLCCNDRSFLNNKEIYRREQQSIIQSITNLTFKTVENQQRHFKDISNRPSKLSLLSSLLLELHKNHNKYNNNNKALICVAELDSFETVAGFLSQSGYSFVSSDSSIPEQCISAIKIFTSTNPIIESDNIESPFVFLLQVPMISSNVSWNWLMNSSSYSIGNTVILYDSNWISKTVENNVLSLCHCIPSPFENYYPEQITVYRLFTQNTIEEHLIQQKSSFETSDKQSLLTSFISKTNTI